ncbi:MAG TPA: zinc ribbon domain-containing protein, partial [Burkholderiaceae bacterium]|nr:zinc ribbon domain-containing protein [Burkholderiaceae bacterium]
MNVQPCPYCEYGNTIGAKFCNECGSPLHLRPCPSCQRVSDASATRCDFCGTPFAALPVVPANDDDPDVPTLPAPEPGTGAAAHDPETMESSLEATEHALQEFERRRASSGAERSTARESLFARIEADLARTMREAAGPSRDAARADARVGPARDATDRPAGRPGAGVGARAPGTLPDGTRPEPVPVLRETIPDLDDVLTELSAPIDGLDGPIPELDIPFDDPSAGGPAADATRRTPGAPSRPVVPAAADASAAPFGPRGPARDEVRAPAERAPDAIGTDGAPPHAGDPPAPSTDASQAATDPIGTDPASRWKRFDEFAARLREGSAAAAGERPASEASGASLVGADAVPGPFAPAPGVDGEIRDESSRPTDDVDAAAGTRTGERADDPAAAADAPADAGVGRA